MLPTWKQGAAAMKWRWEQDWELEQHSLQPLQRRLNQRSSLSRQKHLYPATLESQYQHLENLLQQ